MGKTENERKRPLFWLQWFPDLFLIVFHLILEEESDEEKKNPLKKTATTWGLFDIKLR